MKKYTSIATNIADELNGLTLTTECTALTDYQRQQIRRLICDSLAEEKGLDYDLYEDPQPEDVWSLEKELMGKKRVGFNITSKVATIEEFINTFVDFYSGYAY